MIERRGKPLALHIPSEQSATNQPKSPLSSISAFPGAWLHSPTSSPPIAPIPPLLRLHSTRCSDNTQPDALPPIRLDVYGSKSDRSVAWDDLTGAGPCNGGAIDTKDLYTQHTTYHSCRRPAFSPIGDRGDRRPAHWPHWPTAEPQRPVHSLVQASKSLRVHHLTAFTERTLPEAARSIPRG